MYADGQAESLIQTSKDWPTHSTVEAGVSTDAATSHVVSASDKRISAVSSTVTAVSRVRGFLQMERAAQQQSSSERAHNRFAKRGVAIERVLTDNGAVTAAASGLKPCRTPEPATNVLGPIIHKTDGGAERFHRNLPEERIRLRPRTPQTQRTTTHKGFLHHYNHHRTHSASK